MSPSSPLSPSESPSSVFGGGPPCPGLHSGRQNTTQHTFTTPPHQPVHLGGRTQHTHSQLHLTNLSILGAEHNTRSQLHLTDLSILGGKGGGGGGAEHNTTSPTCPFWGAQHNTTQRSQLHLTSLSILGGRTQHRRNRCNRLVTTTGEQH